MAHSEPNPVSLRRAVYLCLLAVASPARFTALEDQDNKILNTKFKTSPPPIERGAFKLRRALLSAGILVPLAGAVGWLVGRTLGKLVGPASSGTLVWFQVGGALCLLWGTLAVRGWDIQTHGGVTLTERVNHWIYRFLYCTGTGVLVASLAWPSR